MLHEKQIFSFAIGYRLILCPRLCVSQGQQGGLSHGACRIGYPAPQRVANRRLRENREGGADGEKESQAEHGLPNIQPLRRADGKKSRAGQIP